MKTPLDIRDHPETIDCINRELEGGNIIEVKRERDKIVVVHISRTVKNREEL